MQFIIPKRHVLFAPIVSLLCAVSFFSSTAGAQIRRMHRGGLANGAAAGVTAFPYQTSDGHGDTWLVYQPAMVQMQGNFPVYQQTAAITVNGNQPAMSSQPRLDEKTGELIMENLQLGGFLLTRRMLFNQDDGSLRVIDIIKNPQSSDQPLPVQLLSYTMGIQNSQLVPDPKKDSQNIAWVATVPGGNPRAAVDVYGGPNCKVAPTIDSPQGGNSATATFNVTVPANKEIAIAHFHLVTPSQDQGVAWVSNMKISKLFADLPRELRAEIVNFRASNGLLGDLELLRGDLLDVVELRSGDKFNGNLTETDYKLDTFYGTLDIPVNKVVSIINTGQFRPRQLLVTSDGQILGGHLEKPSVELELTSGQKTQIPLAQISRVGYRHRPDESEDSLDDGQMQAPYLLMTSGDRVSVSMPTDPITIVTRYGTLQLSPSVIASITFNSEDSGVHTIELTDGSKFNGLATATEFDLKLTAAAKDQDVKFPVGSLNRIIFNVRPDTKDDTAATLQLKKDDVLAGSLTGDLKLDTAFDTIALHAPELRAITHDKESPTDLSVTTWDGTIFSGQLQQQAVTCHLTSGIDVQVPIGLLENYTNPSAVAPQMILDRIKTLVGDLNADDWKQRDAAEQQLVKMGVGVGATLKSMRDQQPPEAQQRIDSIVKQLQK
jgi:hypothetical protein